jgi:hypothetical protein
VGKARILLYSGPEQMPVHPPGGGGWRVETTSSYPPTGVLVHTGFFYDTTGQYLTDLLVPEA